MENSFYRLLTLVVSLCVLATLQSDSHAMHFENESDKVITVQWQLCAKYTNQDNEDRDIFLSSEYSSNLPKKAQADVGPQLSFEEWNQYEQRVNVLAKPDTMIQPYFYTRAVLKENNFKTTRWDFDDWYSTKNAFFKTYMVNSDLEITQK
jgi:hypothetical protein